MLIVALGNPGPEYTRTRHNIAWQMIEHLSFFPELKWQSRFSGDLATYGSEKTGNQKIHLLCPMTYMNLSGRSVSAAMKFFKLEIEELLVIHDEIEMDFGMMGFKKGGGLAGHNGLRSIVSCLGSRDFNRLRIGISKPEHGNVTTFVLGKFSPEEQEVLDTFLEHAARILEENLTEDIDILVQKYKKYRILQKM